ncbi:unnamed protein product [Diamesa hyperborea]
MAKASLFVVCFALMFCESMSMNLLNDSVTSLSTDLENAVLKIIKSNSIKQFSTLYLIGNCSESQEFTSKSFVDGLFNSSKTFHYEDQRQLIINQNTTRSLSLIDVENVDSFHSLLQYITPKRFHFHGYFLIVLHNGNDVDIQTIFELLWKKFIYNVNVVMKMKNGIHLLTFIPFNQVSCGNTTPIIINQFNKSTGNWNGEEFFPKKHKNFFHCPIRIVTYGSTPSVIVKYTSNQSYELSGFEIDIIEKMSEIFNFSIDYHFDYKGNYGEVFENGSSSGSMKMVIDSKVDMMTGGLYLTEIRLKHMSSSEFYETDPMVIIIPRGEPLSPLEKLFRNYGEVFENGSSSGSIKMVMDSNVDMMTGGMYLTEIRLKHMSSSEFYETDAMIVIIPRGEPLSPLEKLFRPFNTVLWICLISNFIVGACVISIINCQSVEIKNLVIGRQIRNPFMNFAIALVGGSQHILPKRNFSRVLLMFFLLFCLVVRSLYVGGLYIFLQSEQRTNEISTLDEINERGLTVYMHQGILKILTDLVHFKKREIIDYKYYTEYRKKTLDKSFKGVVSSGQINVLYFNKMNHKNKTLKICKQYIFNAPLVFYFTKNFHFVEEFSLMTLKLKEAGLINKWYSKYIDKAFEDFKEPKRGPQKLSFNHLLGGFQMYLLGILFSTLVFIFEKINFLSLLSNDLENAVLKIIESNSIEQFSTLYLIGSSSEFTSKSFVNGLLNSSKAFHYEDQRQLIENQYTTRSLSLIDVENVDTFHSMLQYITPKRFHFNGYFLIVLQDGNDEEIQTIFELLWKKFIYNVNVVMEMNNGVVNLMTFIPFNQVSCGNTTPVLINQFNKSTGNWNSEEFFPKKQKNFFQCPIRIVAFESVPLVLVKYTTNQSYELSGLEVEIIQKMSDIFNFSIDYHLTSKGNYGEVFVNGSSIGSMKMVMDSEVDMMMGGMYLSEIRYTYMSSSEFYETDPMVIIIPRGKPFTPLEKLFRPFNTFLWICLIFTFILGACVISIINCQSAEIRNFVIGRQIKNPFMNFSIALVGGSQHVLPKRNFSRVLLMFFLLFCLVVRSLYVGGLYIFLQSEQRTNEISTLDEINEKGFTVYMHRSIEKILTDLVHFKKRELIAYNDYFDYRTKTFDTSFKGVVSSDELYVAYFNKLNYRNHTFKICKQYIFNAPLVFYFTKNFHFVDEFSMMTIYLKEAGLMNKWYSKYVDKTFEDFKQPKHGPQKLNTNHLLGGFQIYLLGILISTLVFVFEKINFRKLNKLLRKK